MAINVEKLRNYGIRIFKERNWKKLTRNYFGDGMSVRSQHKYKRIIIV